MKAFIFVLSTICITCFTPLALSYRHVWNIRNPNSNSTLSWLSWHSRQNRARNGLQQKLTS